MQNTNFPKYVLGILLISWIMAGCATPPTYNKADPFEKFNRGVFAVNDGLDKIVLRPAAETYTTLVPEPVDTGISNFFSNIDDVVVVANDLLQLKFKQAAADAGRFVLNSTVGLLGFVDVASEFGLPKHLEDFGQTLGYWGVSEGPYLVLPFFGPSSVRDTLGLGADIFLDPRFYVSNLGTKEARSILASEAINSVDMRADLMELEELLEVAALDEYSYLRDAYLARRNYLVYDENPPLDDDMFGDEDDDYDDDESEDEESEDYESEDDEDDASEDDESEDDVSESEDEQDPSGEESPQE